MIQYHRALKVVQEGVLQQYDYKYRSYVVNAFYSGLYHVTRINFREEWPTRVFVRVKHYYQMFVEVVRFRMFAHHLSNCTKYAFAIIQERYSLSPGNSIYIF